MTREAGFQLRSVVVHFPSSASLTQRFIHVTSLFYQKPEQNKPSMYLSASNIFQILILHIQEINQLDL